MSIRYVGNCDFDEVANSDINKDPWNMDSMSRTFEGRKDKLDVFLKTLRKSKPDEKYKTLFATEWRINIGRAFASVVVEYAGLLDGKIPDPVEEDDNQSATVQLSNAAGEQVEVEYTSPTTTIRYVSRTRPIRYKYPNRLHRNLESFKIIKRTGNKNRTLIDIDAFILGGRDPNKISYTTDIVNKQNAVQVGYYWRVTEINEGILIDGEAVPAAIRGFKMTNPVAILE